MYVYILFNRERETETHIQEYKRMHKYKHTYMNEHVYIHLQIFCAHNTHIQAMHTSTYLHLFIHTSIQTYINNHTHTQTRGYVTSAYARQLTIMRPSYRGFWSLWWLDLSEINWMLLCFPLTSGVVSRCLQTSRVTFRPAVSLLKCGPSLLLP